MAKFTKLFWNGCQGFSMDAYPIESPLGGELLVELFKVHLGNTIKDRLVFFAKYPFKKNSDDARYNYKNQ